MIELNVLTGKNYVSCPVEETRAINDIPELTPVEVKAHDPATGWYTPTHLEAGKGFLMRAASDVAVPLYGAGRVISAEDIAGALGVGENLVGPGVSDIDISKVFSIGSAVYEFYPLEYDKATDTWHYVTIMKVGEGHWIFKNDFTYTYLGAMSEAGEEITFRGLPIGLTDRYVWSFGDGTTGEGEAVTHTYVAPASYTVTLELVDATSGAVRAKISKDIPVGEEVQKAIVVSSAGFLGYVRKKEVKETAYFGADVDKLTIATLFVNACKVELSIGGEKVAELEAKYNAVETKTVDLKEGAGIPTDGKDLEIELKCVHVIGSGLKYAACATIIGVK